MEDKHSDGFFTPKSLKHRIMMFLLSLISLIILIRVTIVASPGYNFHPWFGEPEILTKLDSFLIRAMSVVFAIPLLYLTPAFLISVINDEFADKPYKFMDKLAPILDKILR